MTDETKATVEYVVQMAKKLGEVEKVDDQGGRRIGVEQDAWQDIATVEVPAHTQRKTIIGLAIARSGVKPEVGGEPLKLRALDVRSAHVTVVSAKAVDPTLEMS